MTIDDRAQYDAIVVGGGPAGATAGIALARAGWRVAVVEKKAFPRRKVCGEFVSASSWPLFEALGVAGALAKEAGPEVRRVGLFAGTAMLSAPMPRGRDATQAWGRALGRERLDSILLARAAEAGAHVLQPWTIASIERDGAGCRWTIRGHGDADRRSIDLRADIVIAAHGSWEPGPLPTQRAHAAPRASDLLAFKAHFRDARLPPGLMPLLIFPGGYGGMVHTDRGRVSLSCCIRRDALERCRRSAPGDAPMRAASAVLAHIEASCRGVREALRTATLDDAWLSAGPIRPGIRPFAPPGIFPVGNVAGEAHPIIAEGISMAIQSAWMLCTELTGRADAILGGHAHPSAFRSLEAVQRRYARGWRRNFALRVRAASSLAQLAMRPSTAQAIVAIARCAPFVLTAGAHLAGKSQALRCAAGLPQDARMSGGRPRDGRIASTVTDAEE